MMDAWSVSVEFMDNGEEIHTWVTRWTVSDGVLHLFSRSGRMVPEEHVASYPLVNIRKWKRSSR